MAEAFAHLHGQDCLQAHSAGSKPSGKVNEKAIRSMKEQIDDHPSHNNITLDYTSRLVRSQNYYRNLHRTPYRKFHHFQHR